jgi:hypothetical protein
MWNNHCHRVTGQLQLINIIIIVIIIIIIIIIKFVFRLPLNWTPNKWLPVAGDRDSDVDLGYLQHLSIPSKISP